MAAPSQVPSREDVQAFAASLDKKFVRFLRNANSELQAITDAMPVGLVISRDPECRYFLGNPRAYQLLREPPGSNLSKSAPEGLPFGS